MSTPLGRELFDLDESSRSNPQEASSLSGTTYRLPLDLKKSALDDDLRLAPHIIGYRNPNEFLHGTRSRLQGLGIFGGYSDRVGQSVFAGSSTFDQITSISPITSALVTGESGPTVLSAPTYASNLSSLLMDGQHQWYFPDAAQYMQAMTQAPSVFSDAVLCDTALSLFPLSNTPSNKRTASFDNEIEFSNLPGSIIMSSSSSSQLETYSHSFSGEWLSCTPWVVKHRVASPAVCKASGKRRKLPPMYVCSVPSCAQTFTTKHNLLNHTASHNGEKLYKCNSAQCSKAFITKSDRNRHEKNSNIHPELQQKVVADSY